MKKLLMVFIILLVGVSTVSATIVNNTPPSWPRGGSDTTCQAWGFNNANNPADLDIDLNPFGTPSAQVYGVDPPPSIPFDPYNTFWKDQDNGHQGVWRIYGESFLLLYMPNLPVQNEQKIVQLQMTYYASGYTGADPELMIFSTPTATDVAVNQISKVQVDEHFYYHVIWEIAIEPNPNEEWIKIQPRDCTIYLDEVVVDTICIPEPATITLLSLSALAMLKKRRA